MPWLVRLTKPPQINDFRSDYFPRKFHYKKDAQELVDEVAHKGGKAVVEKVVKGGKQPSKPQRLIEATAAVEDLKIVLDDNREDLVDFVTEYPAVLIAMNQLILAINNASNDMEDRIDEEARQSRQEDERDRRQTSPKRR